MKMSEICRKAANEHLWDGNPADVSKAWTVGLAILKAIKFDIPVGNNPAARFEKLFGDGVFYWEGTEETQGARFMLLHFAALYFEDLGE
jgi:hypothetical protein